jgi:hypothetical protein
MKIEKRFTTATRSSAPTPASHFTERVFTLNATDAELREPPGARRRAAPRHDQLALRAAVRARQADRRQRRRLLERLIGGWSVNAIGQFQSGRRSTSSAQHLLQRRSRTR